MTIKTNTHELSKKSDKQLMKIKDQLHFSLIRASSVWNTKEEKMVSKKGGKQGENTKQVQQIKRVIARINNILNSRDLSNTTCKNKPLSKRRRRRLRGRNKE